MALAGSTPEGGMPQGGRSVRPDASAEDRCREEAGDAVGIAGCRAQLGRPSARRSADVAQAIETQTSVLAHGDDAPPTAEARCEEAHCLNSRACPHPGPRASCSRGGTGLEQGVHSRGCLAVCAESQSADRREGAEGREDASDGRGDDAVVSEVEKAGCFLVLTRHLAGPLGHGPAGHAVPPRVGGAAC